MNSKVCTKCEVEKLETEFSFRNMKIGKRYEQCKECINKYAKEYRRVNAGIIQERNHTWYQTSGKAWKEQYEKDNRERINDNAKTRYATDVQYRLSKVLRNRLRKTLLEKGENSAQNLLGAPLSYFKKWIAYQFRDDMSWSNYGTVWDIDHVKPCAAFDFTHDEDVRKCYHWSNMQPLEKHLNYSKGDTIDMLLITNHANKVQKFMSIFPVPNS